MVWSPSSLALKFLPKTKLLRSGSAFFAVIACLMAAAIGCANAGSGNAGEQVDDESDDATEAAASELANQVLVDRAWEAVLLAESYVVDSQQEIDSFLGPYLLTFDQCFHDKMCENPDYPEELIAVLDGHVLLIESLVSAVLANDEVKQFDNRGDLQTVGSEWIDANLIAVRAAAAMLQCLDQIDLKGHRYIYLDKLNECAKSRDLYYAALLDANRLSSEFKAEYSAALTE